MTNMQVAIRLRRKARHDRLVLAVFKVCFDDFFDKIQGLLFRHILIFRSVKGKEIGTGIRQTTISLAENAEPAENDFKYF